MRYRGCNGRYAAIHSAYPADSGCCPHVRVPDSRLQRGCLFGWRPRASEKRRANKTLLRAAHPRAQLAHTAERGNVVCFLQADAGAAREALRRVAWCANSAALCLYANAPSATMLSSHHAAVACTSSLHDVSMCRKQRCFHGLIWPHTGLRAALNRLLPVESRDKEDSWQPKNHC